jgi:hypothetical protein
MRKMTQLVPAQKAACVATFAKPPAAVVATTAVWLSLARRHGEAVLPSLHAVGDDDAALRRAVAVDPGGLPQPVRLSLPDWLY